MNEPKQRQGLLAGVLLILSLAVATFLATKSNARQLQIYNLRATTSYQSLAHSVDLSDLGRNSLEIYRSVAEKKESEDSDDDEDEFEEMEEALLEGEDDRSSDASKQLDSILARKKAKKTSNTAAAAASSPACRPHFNLALRDNRWSNTTKFKRIYLYHARKAGGSTIHRYLAKVSDHYGIELRAVEWNAMEEPGTYDDAATFYVTHLREPVERSISHFKYQGRWNCRDLVYGGKRGDFTPTEENANKLETWMETGGHVPYECRMRGKKSEGGKHPIFFLGSCAVNCFTQWFSGLSCPTWEIPAEEQYAVAMEKVLQYNFIFVIEKLRDPAYVQAVEKFFGVPGIAEKGQPYCEKQSHRANAKFPLIVRDDTRAKLTTLNKVDIQLYHELTDCLEDVDLRGFPTWDPDRFDLHTYNASEAKIKMREAKAAKKAEKEAKKAQKET
ncbi:hypothetical protein ACHAXT_012307 [Thalassiosira profunda]